MQNNKKDRLPTWEEVIAEAKTIRFEPVEFKPEILCGTTSEYEQEPVRALLDLTMFFNPDGSQRQEFAYRPLDRVPPHILAFIVRRLFKFSDPKERRSLDAVFGPLSGKQRSRVLNEHRDNAISSEFWSHPDRIKLQMEGLSDTEIRKRVPLGNEEAARLSGTYLISKEAIRKITRQRLPKIKWRL